MDLIIDTTKNSVESTKSRDPYDHLGAEEWVQKQIEYGSQEHVISGRGLVPFIKQLTGDLVGCEIGVCHGFTTKYFLENIPAIKKLYAVDSYPSFVDWDGTRVTAERQDFTKKGCFERLSSFNDKVVFAYVSSAEFASNLEDNSLDFIFIDGDHSYDATLKDCELYWPKVKSGGIFAGHDINLDTVNRAVVTFLSNLRIENEKIKVVENNAWFLIKD